VEHNIKILKNYADRILCGEKDFEVRLNDRDYQKDDIILFTVIEKDGAEIPGYDGMKRQIKYVHSGLGMKKGYVILGLREVE
jgi:ASC-1-like (ASCH) protein